MASAAEARLVEDLGLPALATLGGATSKLAAMKAKLQKRSSSARSTLAILPALDAAAAEAAVAAGKVVAMACSREEAGESWPAVAASCEAVCADDGVENDHVSIGSFVALGGDAAWCFGGWTSQRAVRAAAAAVVAEARRRSGAGRRDFFVCRPAAACGDAERKTRLDHLFAGVPGREQLRLDEEGACFGGAGSLFRERRRRPTVAGGRATRDDPRRRRGVVARLVRRASPQVPGRRPKSLHLGDAKPVWADSCSVGLRASPSS